MNLNIQNCKTFSRNISPNTFIGGIAKQGGTGANAPIDTPYKVAESIGVSVSRISGFRVVGNDVHCRVKGTYALRGFGSNVVSEANQNITSFNDDENLVVAKGVGSGFHNCKIISFIKLNAIESVNEGMFRLCTSPELEVEMNSLKKISGVFFSQLSISFTQDNLIGFPLLEELGPLSFHNVYGFTSIDISSLKRISQQCFYRVYNCENYILNNVEEATGAYNWAHGSSKVTLIEMKKCKVTGTRFFYDSGAQVPHPSNFTMRLHIDIKTSSAVIDTKTRFPWAVIEFYDDNGDYVETI